MMSKSGPTLERTCWTLLLGPGEVLGELRTSLEALAQTHPDSRPSGIEQLEDWNALFCDLPEVGRILVDADHFEVRTLDLLGAFLNHSPGWELVLLSTGGNFGGLRELLRLPRSKWILSPLALESIHELLQAPSTEACASIPATTLTPEPRAQRPTPPSSPALGENSAGFLDEVERILRGDAQLSPPAPRQETGSEFGAAGPAVSLAEPQLDLRPAPGPVPSKVELSERSELPSPTISGPIPPAPYFKHQVADLADLVQCVDLGLDQVVNEVAEIEGPRAERLAAQFEQMSGEVARLRQFTHTLSFLASPPAGGQQTIDIGPLLEEMLTSRRGEPEAPRFLLRTPEPLSIRTDKILLSQALDALLFFCQVSAGSEGTVRVDGRTLEPDLGADTGTVQVSIRFPAGRFSEFSPAEILEPYSLRRELPELGANSLAAASGIVRGQGGTLELHKEPKGGLEWLLRLPMA
ncbi:MAG: hypothetical protein ACI9F9_001815 [Candidatus Paceibacteria bacterium]|jgi:hypothetical protein